MDKSFLWACASALMIAGCNPPAEVPLNADTGIDRSEDVTVARVDGSPVYLSDVARLAVGQERVSDVSEFTQGSEGFAEVRDEVVDQRVLARAARAEGLHTTEEAARRRLLFEERMLGNLLVERHLEEVVTEEALRDLYEQQLVIRDPVPQVRAAHILVESEDEAEAARARVEAGEAFADVAAEVSLDTATAAGGGELGWFTREAFATPFTDVAFATEPGAMSVPVETEFGWHVIRVEATRSDVPPTYAELRDELEAFLTYDEIEALVKGLRDEAEIVRLPEDGEQEE